MPARLGSRSLNGKHFTIRMYCFAAFEVALYLRSCASNSSLHIDELALLCLHLQSLLMAVKTYTCKLDDRMFRYRM